MSIRSLFSASSACYSSSAFSKIYRDSHIPTSTLQKLEIAIRSGFSAVSDPENGGAVAALGDTLGRNALERMREQMRNDEEGQQILRSKPLFDEASIRLDELRSLPLETVGRTYVDFMDKNQFHFSEREPVRFVDDEELAYVMTRYRQLHDITHSVYGIGISVEAEVMVKCIELIHTRMPMTFFATFLGAFACPVVRIRGGEDSKKDSDFARRNSRPNSFIQFEEGSDASSLSSSSSSSPFLSDSSSASSSARKVLYPRRMLITKLLPWATMSAMKLKRPLHLVYVEKWFDRPLQEFRDYCGIEVPPDHLRDYTH